MNPSESSPELLHKASRGDVEALSTLLERHLPALRAYVRLRTGQAIRAKESVSDLVQSVCREIFQYADRFQHGGEAGFKQWLYTTALRKISKRGRYYQAERRDAGREVAPPPDQSHDQLLTAYASFCTPSRVVAARERVAEVEAAFDALSDDFREVIVLAKVVGLSRAEIARKIDRTEAAVGNLLYRAMAELSGILKRREKREE